MCTACAGNCLKCGTKGPGLCDDNGCVSGYTALSTNHECVKCLNGCTSCSGQDFTVCLSCSDGTYLSGKSCLSCIKGCSTCSSQSVCSICSEGYSLRVGVCYPTPGPPCAQSSADGVCIGCISNYQLINATCQIITAKVCASNCTQCPFGYYLSSGKACLSCPATANCLQCDSTAPASCLKCASGFYWNGAACTACDVNCQLCSGPSRCFLAKSGYYLVKDNAH
jgi:proprotein convertase subtilisin/kexin type 5